MKRLSPDRFLDLLWKIRRLAFEAGSVRLNQTGVPLSSCVIRWVDGDSVVRVDAVVPSSLFDAVVEFEKTSLRLTRLADALYEKATKRVWAGTV